MLNRYDFIIPVLLVWLIIFFVPMVLVFFTKIGQKNLKILNRRFLTKFINISLFIIFLLIMLSGLLQLLSDDKVIFGKSDNYLHALVGFIFLLMALNHVIIHIKVIYRYFIKKKSVGET